jgi:hypothetical protein
VIDRQHDPEWRDEDDTPLLGGSYPHGRGTLPMSCLKPEPVRREEPRWCFWLFLAAFWAMVICLWVLSGSPL